MLFAAIFAIFVFGVSVSDAAPRAAGGERRLAVREDKPKPTGRLLGGDEIPNFNDWPFYVTMRAQYLDSSWGEYHCPGLVFNNRTIITTAQCVNNAKSWYVKFDTMTVDCGDNTGVPVEGAKVHEDYDDTYTYNRTFLPNDIGLVFLKEDLVLEECDECLAVHLPDQDEDTAPQTATIIGYSTDDNIWAPDMHKYRKVELSILSEQICSDYAGNYYHPAMHICVKDLNEEQAACINDQSSPVILDDEDQTVVGLGSWIYSACIYSSNSDRFEYPAYYVRLANYIDWISDNAE